MTPQGKVRAKTEVTTWGATNRQVKALTEHLVAQGVESVVMEATGGFWKPFFYEFEKAGRFEVVLANPRHVRNMPRRKSDVSDAAWLAQLAAHGLVSASFVPPAPIRALRDLTRTRSTLVRQRSAQVLRLEAVVQDAGVKLSDAASNIMGASGRAMLGALADGGQSAEQIAAPGQRSAGGQVRRPGRGP
jgi:transposase